MAAGISCCETACDMACGTTAARSVRSIVVAAFVDSAVAVSAVVASSTDPPQAAKAKAEASSRERLSNCVRVLFITWLPDKTGGPERPATGARLRTKYAEKMEAQQFPPCRQSS